MKRTFKKKTVSAPSSRRKTLANQRKRAARTPTVSLATDRRRRPSVQAPIAAPVATVPSEAAVEKNLPTCNKERRICLWIPATGADESFNALLLEDQLRLLTKDVQAAKVGQPLEDAPIREEADLLLVVAGSEPLPEPCLAAIRNATVPTALWVADERRILAHHRSLAPLFDYAFTQQASNVPEYAASGAKRCYHLPFASNGDVYYPRQADSEFASDVLLIGDAGSAAETFLRSPALAGKKTRIVGNGRSARSNVLNGATEEQLASYVNGARIVVNFGPDARRVHDVAACGVFQLVRAELLQAGGFGNFHVIFRTPEELEREYAKFEAQTDLRRLLATQALSEYKYNQTYLHKGMKLLNIVFA